MLCCLLVFLILWTSLLFDFGFVAYELRVGLIVWLVIAVLMWVVGLFAFCLDC